MDQTGEAALEVSRTWAAPPTTSHRTTCSHSAALLELQNCSSRT